MTVFSSASSGSPSSVLRCLPRNLSAWGLALLYTAIPLAGMAQESQEGDDPSLDLGTITVTGQKSKRSLAETDGSVTVIFPGENDGVAGATDNIFGVAERLANIMPFAASSGVAIRGIGQTGFSSGPTFGQTSYLVTRGPGDLVATYVDGIPVSVYAGPFGFWDVEQMEVLRGAQSTVLGRGSLGGAVVIENADPTFATEAAGQLKSGTNKGGLGTSFFVSGPILDDRFAYRVAFDRQAGPSFIDNVTRNENGDRHDLLSRRVKLLYAGEHGAELELSTFFSHTNVGTHYVDADTWPDQKVTRADPNTNLENHATGASLRGSWPLGHSLFSLESATVWVKEDGENRFDVDQTEIPGDIAHFKDNIRTLSQELRLRYAGDNFNGFIGAYLEDFQGKGDTKSGIFGEKTIKQDVQTMALFGEGKWSLSKKMDLTLGLRIEQEKNETAIDANRIIDFLQLGRDASKLTELQTKVASGTITQAEQLQLRDLGVKVASGTLIQRSNVDHKLDKDFSVLLPKLGLSYAISPETRIYGTVQQGYRAGGAGTSLISAIPFEYDAEKTWNVDLGIRYKGMDGRLRLSSNLFYVDWQDQQLQVTPPGGAILPDLISVNAGRSKSYGLELEADYQASQRLRLFGSLGLLRTEITESTDERVKEWIGNSFTMAPNTTISAGWSYDFDHGLDFSMAANWRDSFFSDIQNRSTEKVDSRLLVDMGVGYEFPNRDLRLDLKIANVFNERYLNYSYTTTLKGVADRLAGLAQVDPTLPRSLLTLPTQSNGIVSPGDGRTISFTLTARF